MIKLIAFDLDGTLTQHKTKLDQKNKAVLDRLAEKYHLVMAGAGLCMRIFNQMIHIIQTSHFELTLSFYSSIFPSILQD